MDKLLSTPFNEVQGNIESRYEELRSIANELIALNLQLGEITEWGLDARIYNAFFKAFDCNNKLK